MSSHVHATQLPGELSDPLLSSAHATQLPGGFGDPVLSRAHANQLPGEFSNQVSSHVHATQLPGEVSDPLLSSAHVTQLPSGYGNSVLSRAHATQLPGESSNPVSSHAHASQLPVEFSNPGTSFRPYVNQERDVRSWRVRKHTAPLNVQNEIGSDSSAADTGVQYLEVMKNLAVATLLPKSEMISFDGNPLKYFTFLRSFETNVEKDTNDFSRRLQLLVQFSQVKQGRLLKTASCWSLKKGTRKRRNYLQNGLEINTK